MKPDPNFIASLLVYSHRRDQAIGIGWHGQRVLGLCWYHNHLMRQQLALFASADYLRQKAEQNEARKNDIVAKARRYKSPRKRKEALENLQTIEQEQAKIAQALEQMTNG